MVIRSRRSSLRRIPSSFRSISSTSRPARTNPKPGKTPPPLQVEFEETVYVFEWVLQGDPVQPRFPFRNLTSEDIVVEKIYAPDWLIKDRTEKRLIPAGEAGEIIVDVNTSNLRLDIGQDIFVRFEPIKETGQSSASGAGCLLPKTSSSPPASRKKPPPERPPRRQPPSRAGRRRLMRWGEDAGPRLPKKQFHEGEKSYPRSYTKNDQGPPRAPAWLPPITPPLRGNSAVMRGCPPGSAGVPPAQVLARLR